jgi:hypothetical protein
MSIEAAKPSTIFIPFSHDTGITRSNFWDKNIRFERVRDLETKSVTCGFKISTQKIQEMSGRYLECHCTNAVGFGDASKEHWFSVHISADTVAQYQSMNPEDRNKHEWVLNGYSMIMRAVGKP